MSLPEITDREQAILTVLCEAGEPLNHAQIVTRLEPWYDKPSSFKASVSSYLGTMRSKRLIKTRWQATGARPIYVHGMQIMPRQRLWFPSAQVLETHDRHTSLKVRTDFRPHTDDMVQMLDDIARIEIPPKERLFMNFEDAFRQSLPFSFPPL